MATDINILLIGETGVGKSTFVNSLVNYLHHIHFKNAQKDLLTLIPGKIMVLDKDMEVHTFALGSDQNEFQEVGESATQDVKTYVFPIGDDGHIKIRLIDTPGMGDTRGTDQDDRNCENILTYISSLHELHAILFLFKPNDSRITVHFEYCIKQILSRLDKSASNNIIFGFTNTKGTNYQPAETIVCLQKMIEKIKNNPPHAVIPCKDNIFNFDNESYKYLAALQKGIQLDEKMIESSKTSWKMSARESWRLISYITGDNTHKPLKPHMVKNSTSINEARMLIYKLAQPLAEITDLIHDNVRILRRREADLKAQNLSLDDLKNKLYIPIINLNVIKLSQPVTVCTSNDCTEVITIEEIKKWHYKQRCHDPCYLSNVPKEVVGTPELRNCASMNPQTQTCLMCGCTQNVHMHVYYHTQPVDGKRIDENINKNITSMSKALKEAQRLIGEVNKRKTELEEERKVIVTCTARFAFFLQQNAITPFNDSYKAYIEYMIIQEKSMGMLADNMRIHHLEDLLKQYEEMKESFQAALELSNTPLGKAGLVKSDCNAQDIMESVKELYNLKHNGQKIHEMYKAQKVSRRKEHGQTEYVHKSVMTQPLKKEQAEKQGSAPGKNSSKKPAPNSGNKKPEPQQKNFKPFQNRHYDQSRTQQNQRNARPPPVQNTQIPPLLGIRPQFPAGPPPPYEPYPRPPPQPSKDKPNDREVKILTNDIEVLVLTKPGNKSNESQNSNNESYRNNNHPNNYFGSPRGDGYNDNAGYGYQNSLNDYRRTSNEYTASYNNYRGLPNDYRGPPSDYRGPPNDYRGPPNEYRGPPHDYRGPPNDYRGPPNDYYRGGPPNDYRGPPNDYRGGPGNDYRGAPNDYKGPPNDYRSPPNDYRGPPNDYRGGLPHDYRGPPNDYRAPPNDYRGPSNDYRGVPNDYRQPPNNYRGQPNDYKGLSNDYKGRPNDYRGVPNDFRGPANDYRGVPNQYKKGSNQGHFQKNPNQRKAQSDNEKRPQHHNRSKSQQGRGRNYQKGKGAYTDKDTGNSSSD